MRKWYTGGLIAVVLAGAFLGSLLAAYGFTVMMKNEASFKDVTMINGIPYLPVYEAASEVEAESTPAAMHAQQAGDNRLSASTGTEEVFRSGEFAFQQLIVKQEEFGPDVTVELMNEGKSEADSVVFTASFYKEDGERIGTASGSVTSLGAGERRVVRLLTGEQNLNGFTEVRFQIDHVSTS
ncbi:FxLYD domain-containing protein [Paenibacillus tarimensis]|uniref:FxLYD domain-containing protein n=1 Tax=Paenibacillus tarimensis TaxID=416012 RepID=UPI001F2F101C|nr:FxLYD domain-containing protein [Paenibacillus tarimensis]MCF2942154.1 FxLYD domain-containing protein [Paenibacillus tarimensis]